MYLKLSKLGPNYYNTGHVINVIYLDYKKAFDTVPQMLVSQINAVGNIR